MIYYTQKTTGVSVLKPSKLGLGLMRLPRIQNDKEDIDYDKAKEIVNYAYENGITYYDTAYFYHGGTSEEFTGKALKEFPRDTYLLATKMPGWALKTEEDLDNIFNEQLRRLQTDYIDYYLYHSVNQSTLPNFYKYNCYEFLMKKKKEGKIRKLGFSFHDTPQVLKQLIDEFEWDFAQIQLNYLDWELQDAKTQYRLLEEKNIPCIVMEPVRGGALAELGEKANNLLKSLRPDKSIASWAIRYCASLPNVQTILSGMSNMEQIVDNVNTINNFEPLGNEEYEYLEKALRIYREKDKVPCTNCRYCLDCPSTVDIPKVFDIYNDYVLDMDKDRLKTRLNDIESSRQAGNCTDCKNCMEKCPQSIDIPNMLGTILALVK
jgi:predicted aldo/keto reductase-like oxidoreductase